MKDTIWQNFTNPRAIAVVGASDKPESVGSAVLLNLLAGRYAGQIYPVNPKRDTVHGRTAYPSVAALPGPTDLAVICTPGKLAPGLIRECGAAGIAAAIVLSAGFDEAGAEGRALSAALVDAATESGVRILGPNCVGLISPRAHMNATFGVSLPPEGNVAFLSQSGALGTAILDWSVKENIGLSTFVSLGAMVDMGWAEILDYLADDPKTHSIVIYMESIGNPRAFLSAARELAPYKPIIVLKAGRHGESAQAAMSHTGAMAGSDDVLDAAFDRCGIFRVRTIAELFYMAEALSKQPRPRGPRLTVVTNAGGPGVLAADAVADEGGKLSTLSTETLDALNAILPPSWSKGNPIDVLGDAGSEKYAAAVKAAIDDPNADCILAILTPQAMTKPGDVARAVAELPNIHKKPILASWMGGESVTEGIAILQAASIPSFPYPDTAARIAHYMWRYGDSLRSLYETPQLLDESPDPRMELLYSAEIVKKARNGGRTVLAEYESKQLLLAYDIPTVETWVAQDAGEAVECARRVGYPVALKVNSEIITHKNKVGGVRLNVENEAGVQRAFSQIKDSVTEHAGADAFNGVTVQPMIRLSGCELIIGSKVDPHFGPVLLFGSGGRFAEAIHDFAMALPPLNATLADRLMRKTSAYKILTELGKKSPDVLTSLERALVVFSRLVLDHPEIAEIEINPLLVADDGILALDARVSLMPAQAGLKSGVHTKPAIAPYPSRFVKNWASRTGADMVIRPIRPEDEEAMVRFHTRLSDETVYHRYFSLMGVDRRVAHDRLSRLCFIDYDRQMALVAVYSNPQTGLPEIAGVGRFIRQHRSNTGEFALVVSDLWQGQGLGTELLDGLIRYAREMKVEQITADILPDNEAMQHVCRKLDFDLQLDLDAKVVTACRTLNDGAAVAAAV